MNACIYLSIANVCSGSSGAFQIPEQSSQKSSIVKCSMIIRTNVLGMFVCVKMLSELFFLIH